MIEKKMLLPVVVVALWLSVPDLHFEAYGDASGGAKSCDPPCQQISPPSAPGFPSYEALPPPQPSPPPSGYSIYGYPPPPPHHSGGQSKCPPAAGVQCCTPPVPYTYYGPPNPYNYGPPNPYYYGPPNPYAPPNTYTYVPYGEGQGSAPMLLSFLAPLLMFFSSFILF